MPRAGTNAVRGVPGERAIARLLFRLLIARGWIVQANDPSSCSHIVESDGEIIDEGWHPAFSIRYGKTPVYRGVGLVRWHA
jgi:hypothetical protein